MQKKIYAVLLGLCIMTITSIFYTNPKKEDLIIPPKDEGYTKSSVMEIGGLYKLTITDKEEVIKECDVKVRAEAIHFIEDGNVEICEYKNLDISTIALYNEDKTSCMIIRNKTDKNGELHFDLIGTVTKDIAGEYNLVYKKEIEDFSKLVWDITGEAVETNRHSSEAILDDRKVFMCVALDKEGESYICIYDEEIWKTYTFSILNKTIYLTEVIL